MGQGNSKNLYEAAASDELQRAKHFIENDHADINGQDKDGWTPLHFGAYGGSVQVVSELLRLKADPAIADKGGRVPMHLAALQGRTHVVIALAEAGAGVDARDEHRMTPLHKAAVKGHAQTAEELLNRGANVNGKMTDGATPLHLAAWKGHEPVVKLLLVKGANLRAVKSDGQTPLHEAAEAGHQAICHLLISLGANNQAQDEDGRTPAMLASKGGHEALAALIAKGEAGDWGEARGAPPGRPRPHAAPTPANSMDLGHSTVPDRTWQSAVHTPLPAHGLGGAAPSAPPLMAAPAVWQPGQHGVDAASKDGPIHYPSIDPRPVTFPKADSKAAAEAAARAGGGPAPAPGSQAWWQAQMGQDLGAPEGGPKPGVPQPATHGGERPDPIKQLQHHALNQAQNLWNALQGKGGAEREEGRERRKEQAPANDKHAREIAELNAEWGDARLADEPGPARTEKYDTKPYEDDDDYTSGGGHAGQPARDGPKSLEAELAMRRKLANLELEIDRTQGWARGGTKAQGQHATQQAERLKRQEAELAELRAQLARSHLGPGGFQGGARSGPRDTSVPANFRCPITQEVMQDPVIAADGYCYERSAIMQWLQSGRTVSPITNQDLPHPGLTPNRTLKASIMQWRGVHQGQYA